MKVIRFTYSNTEVDFSVYMLLFFRNAGIYVYERFLEQIEIRKEIVFPSEDIGFIEPFDNFDVDIYLGNDIDVNLMENKTQVPIFVVSYNNKTTKKDVTQSMLKSLFDRHVLRQSELDDLNDFLEIYDQFEMWKWQLRARYFFQFEDKGIIKKLINEYNSTIIELLNDLRNKEVSWGDFRNEHLQFAAMNAIYELNCFCDKSNMPQVCMPETVAQYCEAMREGFSDYLGDSVKMLEAMVYDDLLNNSNKAYQFYVSSCTSETTYNAYVFLRKGLYWQGFTGQLDQAIKYYLKSVKIFPEYYRAWFKIGLCYQKMNKYKEALCAYKNVKQILLRRLGEGQLRPLEIEHLIKSQISSLNIWQDVYHNYVNAFEAGRTAEKAVEAIDTTKFWNYMCKDAEEVQYFKGYMKKCVPIRNVYIKLRDLCRISANPEKEAEYDVKLMDYDRVNK